MLKAFGFGLIFGGLVDVAAGAATWVWLPIMGLGVALVSVSLWRERQRLR